MAQEELSFVPRFGWKRPPVQRFAAVPLWSDANPKIPESQWEEHDDFAALQPPIEAQQNNNCTDASMACLLNLVMKAAGVPDVPRFSWSFNYARHNGGEDGGAFCRKIIGDLLSGVGKPPASVWPDEKIFAPRGGFPAEVLRAAAEWGLLEVYQCMDWADVGSALTRRFCVYHGFMLGNSYSRTGSDGVVPQYDGYLANGHAMHSRGLKRVNGKFRTITPNTWGPSFGDNGVGYWPESYFWGTATIRGQNWANLDAYAIRAVRRRGPLPVAKQE